VHDRVVGQAALIGEVFQAPLGGVGAEQDVAFGYTQAAGNLAQLIGGLRQRFLGTDIFDVGLSAAEYRSEVVPDRGSSAQAICCGVGVCEQRIVRARAACSL
jgi:hypothetical protein